MRYLIRRYRRAAWPEQLALLFVTGFIVTALTVFVAAPAIGALAEHLDRSYRPAGGQPASSELALIVLGAPECTISRSARVRDSVEELKVTLQEIAHQRGYSFSAVGVALTREAPAGLALLESLGRFDELLIGGGERGAGARHYVYVDLPGAAATPQLMLVLRTRGDRARQASWSERVLTRVVGESGVVEAEVNFPRFARSLPNLVDQQD